MNKLFVTLISVLLGLWLCCGCVAAAGNIYGATGLIETPTDLVVGKSELALTGTYFSEFLDSDDAMTIWGGAYGVGDKLEASWSSVDSDAPGSSAKSILGAKLNVTPETATSAGVSVGILDTGKKFNDINPGIDEASYYIVFGKTLNLKQNRYYSRSDENPVRATFGFGKGIYAGVFGGLNFRLASKVEAKLEYLSKGIRDESTVNAALQMNLMPNLTLQVGTLGMEDVYGSVSFAVGEKF